MKFTARAWDNAFPRTINFGSHPPDAGWKRRWRTEHMRRLLTLASLFVLVSVAAQAQDAAGFQSPSKNISCLVFPDGAQNAIRCDVAVMETKPKRPADCELEYGQAFMMDSKGAAERI